MKKAAICCLLVVAAGLLVFNAVFSRWQTENRAPIRISEGDVPTDTEEAFHPDTELININTATLTQLQTLPGIGPVYAQRILQYRQENGPFSSVSQLTLVKGIGLSLLDRILDYITVEDQP